MSFYSAFAPYYDSIFPLEEHVYAFLRDLLPRGGARARGTSPARAGGRILDVGCGTGDYCGRFASEGIEAVGIDLDAEMVAAAERRYPEATFRVADMRDLAGWAASSGPLGARGPTPLFDMVTSIGNVVSHVRRDEFPAFLDGVRHVLAPSGVWIFQVVNWDDILTRERYTFPDIVLDGGRVVFTREYPRVSESGVRFVTRLVEAGRTIFEGEVSLYPMRSQQYAEESSERGLELLGHYADFHRTDFDAGRESSSVFVFAKRR